ncbi:MAG: hypothetical protein JWP89_460 [Schlesneria sp.]|nr:hypothetical protein [Schlesneria sp.]
MARLGTVTIAVDGQLNPSDKAPTLVNNGQFKDKYGSGKSLGPIDKWTNPKLTYKDAGTRIEARALLSPSGVGEIIPIGKLTFKRKLNSIAWFNGGHYIGGSWVAGPSDVQVNADDDSATEFLDVNPAENDSLFDLDIPRFGVPPQYHTCEMYASFVQYVTIKACGSGVQCSADFPWSYRLRIDYDKANNKVDLNDVKTSAIDLPDKPFYKKFGTM